MQRTLTGSVLAVVALGALSWNVVSQQEGVETGKPADALWHTDLATANAIAIENGKPLLVVFR